MIHTDSRPVPAPKPACDRCRGTEKLIVGDGPTVCGSCVELLSELAADPASATQRLRETMLELHGDVLALIQEDGVLSWSWTPQWPGPAARA